MKRFQNPYVLERLVYVVVWLLVFLMPVVVANISTTNDSHTQGWQNILQVWVIGVVPFFILFCINNFWLAPYYLLKKKYIVYVAFVFVVTGAFGWVDNVCMRRVAMHRLLSMKNKQIEFAEKESQRVYQKGFPSPNYQPRELRPPHNREPFPRLLFLPYISRFLIAILMIGFNTSIKLLFKSLKDEETMKELERCKLQSELEYLKYQINPHFFMNTLNNIHALVDVNTQEAQKAIVELSKMMRYVLYESNNRTILLKREIQFLNNYIELMRLRFNNKVNIQVSFPEEVPPVEIPPLLYISFVENAFKHGISYKNDSIICVVLEVKEGNLVFNCSNTITEGQNDDPHSGVGLENVQKRLKLLYDNNFTLSMNKSKDNFNVLLIVPFL